MACRVGELTVRYSARGIPSFFIELAHDGLNKHRVIRGESREVVRAKAAIQIKAWNERWADVSSRNQIRSEKTQGKRHQENQKALATERTSEAQEQLDVLAGLLKATLKVDDRVDWETLKDKTPFLEPMPTPKAAPREPQLPELPREPQSADSEFTPKLSFLDKLISSRRQRIEAEASARFDDAHRKWEQHVERLREAHRAALAAREKLIALSESEHRQRLAAWNEKRAAFEATRAAQHAAIDAKQAAYTAADESAILDYCDMVLSASNYPDYFPQEFDLDYQAANKTLIVDYRLPSPDNLPRTKAIKYVAARDEFETQNISDSQASKLFDDVLYQVTLRTVHELFEADVISALDVVVFNGIVTSVDRTTGKPATACVLSLRASKDEFLAINLSDVDPKACFKALKGVGSSKLHGLSPVPPIMPLRREDGRFVSSYEVANTLDDSVNLAAMDWEDFEHLIREVFEKEFSSNGGEVRVTQASRDGGVDAVAFDPDPIRGGKIVIQAKRYTHTVGVGAVRDLYGTVHNEGATKGILVTTSDYGPDSYEFAKNKPLVLLSGANLLHLLEKHGHRARIDLQEARKLQM